MGTPADTAASTDCDVLIIGAGAAGLIAGLRAHEAGASVLIVERDALPRGSTALSAGLVPAAGTRIQTAAGLSDSAELFALDIATKSAGEANPEEIRALVAATTAAVDWLAEAHGLPFSVVADFSYPGHSARRMHGLPTRSGAELMDALRAAAENAGISILTSATARHISAEMDGRVTAVEIVRPDGSSERISCQALLLACNGYGGDKTLLAQHIPEMARALYFGHPGNQGDAVRWGAQLGADVRHLSSYQGHGSVAHPHGILITWATIMEGGFQVNEYGVRFSDESHGYSEQAANVLAQPGGIAWSIFDARIAGIARQFEDFRNAEAQSALMAAETITDLAARCGLPVSALAETAVSVAKARQAAVPDPFGRMWNNAPTLAPPYFAVRVTGALFHTQGGLVVDASGRVLRPDGTPLPNLFAAGGAACGVSGSTAAGYLSGNGLLTAFGYGYLAGAACCM
jgi:fumarate reductase flavoprotein subunit